MLDDFGDAESADSRSAGRANDDGMPMSDNALNKALRITGYDTGLGGDHCAHGFRSTVSTMLNEEGAFDGDVVEVQLAHDTAEKSAGGVTSWCGASLARATSTGSAASITVRSYWAERMRLMQDWFDRLDSLRDGAPAVSLRR